jgi:hypothetical protein
LQSAIHKKEEFKEEAKSYPNRRPCKRSINRFSSIEERDKLAAFSFAWSVDNKL